MKCIYYYSSKAKVKLAGSRTEVNQEELEKALASM